MLQVCPLYGISVFLVPVLSDFCSPFLLYLKLYYWGAHYSCLLDWFGFHLVATMIPYGFVLLQLLWYTRQQFPSILLKPYFVAEIGLRNKMVARITQVTMDGALQTTMDEKRPLIVQYTVCSTISTSHSFAYRSTASLPSSEYLSSCITLIQALYIC